MHKFAVLKSSMIVYLTDWKDMLLEEKKNNNVSMIKSVSQWSTHQHYNLSADFYIFYAFFCFYLFYYTWLSIAFHFILFVSFFLLYYAMRSSEISFFVFSRSLSFVYFDRLSTIIKNRSNDVWRVCIYKFIISFFRGFLVM